MRKLTFQLLLSIIGILFVFGCEETENIIPTCSITTPNNGDKFNIGTVVTISVNADDADGNITEVRFYIDGSGVGLSSSFPYNYDWNTSSETIGNHTLKATVKDDNGNSISYEITVATIVNPVAVFSCDQTEIYLGQYIQFTNQSTNNSIDWSWDFGDGGTSTSRNPSHIYSSVGHYDVSLTATNSYGSNTETKSDFITVNPHETGTVSDYDGNTYNTIKIGNQWWMAENLKTTHYANGTAITLVQSDAAWNALSYTDTAYCYYDNSTTNADTYGALYTWAAAMNGASSSSVNPSDVQGACPDDWHLPSDNEWKELEMYLGMKQIYADNYGYVYRGTNEGSKLAGNEGLWSITLENWIGTLEKDDAFGTSGFLALPAGFRFDNGMCLSLSKIAHFWSATEVSSSSAWDRSLEYTNSGIVRNGRFKFWGFSVRCLKD